jgi:hypothetical protein
MLRMMLLTSGPRVAGDPTLERVGPAGIPISNFEFKNGLMMVGPEWAVRDCDRTV